MAVFYQKVCVTELNVVTLHPKKTTGPCCLIEKEININIKIYNYVRN